MKPRLRLLALSVLGLLTVLVAGLWVRSDWAGDTWYVYDPPAGREWRLAGAGGVVGFYRVTWDPKTASEGVTRSAVQRTYSRRQWMDWDGRITVLRRDAGLKGFGPILGACLFATDGGRAWPSYHHWEVMVPYRLLFTLSAGPTVWAAWRPMRQWMRLRRQPGTCAKCGYDLRATPDRCPECGAIAAAG